MAKRVRIGDVFEIKTKRGFTYAQYTHFHSQPPRYGNLIRVLPGFLGERPSDLTNMVKLQERFVVFFPLQAAVNQNLVTVVANKPVPSHATDFPVFRAGVPDQQLRKVRVWWFWDGDREWKVGKITKKQKKMPIRMLVNYDGLIYKIESDWTPETDPFT